MLEGLPVRTYAKRNGTETFETSRTVLISETP